MHSVYFMHFVHLSTSQGGAHVHFVLILCSLWIVNLNLISENAVLCDYINWHYEQSETN